jgi:pimeloyl-ACP methyl ester carboxylesterase
VRFTVDRHEAYAYTGGRPLQASQPLVTLVHGAQHDHSVWAMQSRYLAHHGYSLLALDLPGHGRSDGPALESIEAMASWVGMAVPAACASGGLGEVPATIIAGHSMGSLVALETSALKPDWLRGIALVCIGVPMRVSDALLEAAAADEQRAFDMINFWSSAGINHSPGTPGPGFSTYVQNRRLMERQNPGVLLKDFSACNAYSAGLERAATLAMPALFLLAGRDMMTPPRTARKAIDAARAGGATVNVMTVEGSGHNVLAEHPEESLSAFRQWLPTVIPSAQPPGGLG